MERAIVGADGAKGNVTLSEVEGVGVPRLKNSRVVLSTASPRPDYRACGLSASIAHAESGYIGMEDARFMSPVDLSRYMKHIQESWQRMIEHDRKNKIAARRNRDELDGLVAFVNSIFEKHNVAGRITKDHIRFNADFIGNIVNIEDKLLSHL